MQSCTHAKLHHATLHAPKMHAREVTNLLERVLDARHVLDVCLRTFDLEGVGEKQRVDGVLESIVLLALFVLVVHGAHHLKIVLRMNLMFSAGQEQPARTAPHLPQKN